MKAKREEKKDSIINEDVPDYFEETPQEEAPDYDTPLPEADNKRWELDEEPTLQNLRYELAKRLNSTGVEAVMSWLRVSMGKNIALTNLDINEIREIMIDELPAFDYELVQNAEKWGLKSTSSRGAISAWIEKTLYAQLKRAFNDGERKYRKESYGYNENYHHDEVRNDEIGSGFRIPFFGGKKKRQRTPQYEEDERF